MPGQTDPIRSPALLAVACLSLVGGNRVNARTDQALVDQAALLQRLDAVESRLQRLESPQDTPWLTEQRAAEVRVIVASVLAEGDVLMGQLADEAGSGWDDEFHIQSADGAFRLEVGGQIQTRYVWNRRNDDPKDLTTAGFEVRRAKIRLKGFMFDRRIGFTVSVAKRERTGEMVLQSFNIRYRFSPELRVSIGRARPPLLREEQMSSRRQLAVERSLVADAFRQTRTLGLMLRYQIEPVRVFVGFMDATNDFSEESMSYRASTRVEFKLGGEWKQLDDFSSFPGEDPTLAFGTGVLFQDNEFNDPMTGDSHLLRWSADVSLELSGMSFFASFVGNHVEEEMIDNLEQYGIVVQSSVFVAERWEIFGRYEYGNADGVDENLSVATAGVNWFISGHGLKWTADIGYGFSPVGGFWETDGAGWLEDKPGEEGQIVFRTQFQLLY